MSVNFQSLEKIPRHVALIMDGNGRWAQERGLSRIEGHKEGAQSVRAVLRAAAQAGIEYLTVYAFSTENWKRPPQEVDGLMKLLVSSLDAYEQELHDNQIRLRVMGQFERLPLPVRMRLQKTLDATVVKYAAETSALRSPSSCARMHVSSVYSKKTTGSV
jgi:undecaprenyl diphosphate synthase